MIELRIHGGTALVDEEEVARVRTRVWHVTKQGYARSCRYRADRVPDTILMHRFILGLRPGDPRQVDHIDRNRLNNTRQNLRVVDGAGNGQNTAARPNRANVAERSSRFRGVTWYARYGKWRALVTVGGKQHSGGYHEDEVDAALAAQALRDALMPLAGPDSELAKLTNDRLEFA